MGNEVIAGRGVEELYREEEDISEGYTSEGQKSPGEVLFITSYPPRECGIASYSQNLIRSLNNRFDNFFSLRVCALESGGEARYYYPDEVSWVLDTTKSSDYTKILDKINQSAEIRAVIIQHEFDLFKPTEEAFLHFLSKIDKPVIVVFHSVIPDPSDSLKTYFRTISRISNSVLVLARISANILRDHYQVPEEKITVIPYGTHLVSPLNKRALKEKYRLAGRSILTTIGLVSPGKGIETTLEALPAVIKSHPEVLFLVIGKTHPEELKKEGEKYRIMLESRVKSLKLQNHVQFLNGFFTPDILKEYFQMSDICIFSCTDPNRPMSGMFSMAVSCGCPVISTPIAHAWEFLADDAGLIVQNQDPVDFASKINQLLDDPALRKMFSNKILRKSHSSLWENSALLHGKMIMDTVNGKITASLRYPPIKMDFLKMLTDKVGMLHSSYKGLSDLRSGYTLDDNAFALYVFCVHYKNTSDQEDIPYIKKYLRFIYHCFQPTGTFLKYLDYERRFTTQNQHENLEVANAKAIMALGFLFSLKGLVPEELIDISALMLQKAHPHAGSFENPKSLAIALKGLYYYFSVAETEEIRAQIKTVADKMVHSYQNCRTDNWKWFEDKFCDGAGILPAALMSAWLVTGEQKYRDYAKESFDFLLSKVFNQNRVEIREGDQWYASGTAKTNAGEKPCDIAFYVITLSKFYLMLKENQYFNRMEQAFKWFLGENRLNQMIYNPVTGSCFDGLEEESLNPDQSAGSALSYALARIVVDKYKFRGENHINHIV